MNKSAVSGGRLTVKERREKGGDVDEDISWKWLNFFMDDLEELKAIGDAYGSGAMLSGEIKKNLVECLTPMIVAHQEARARVTDAVVDQLFSTAPRDFPSMFGAFSGDAPAPAEWPVSFPGGAHLVASTAPVATPDRGGAGGGTDLARHAGSAPHPRPTTAVKDALTN